MFCFVSFFCAPKLGSLPIHLASFTIRLFRAASRRSIRDGNGRTALHFAATGGSAGVVGAILDMAPSVIDSKVTLSWRERYVGWHVPTGA